MNRQDRRRAAKGNKARQYGATSTLAAALILALAAPGIAHAVPSGPGTGNGPSGPSSGTTAPSAPGSNWAVPITPPSSQGPGVIPDPPSTSGWRANPWAGSTNYVDPVFYEPSYVGVTDPLPLPPPPPMILPEPGKLRAGSWQAEKPTWVSVAEMNSFNRWFAYAESRIAQFWISQGVGADEADRRAASEIAGGLVGGGVGGSAGFIAGAVPGALIGAGLGALAGIPIGGVIGAAALCNGVCIALPPLTAPLLTTGYTIGGIVGAVAGAVTGAVAVGTATGLLVGIPSAIVGYQIGSTLGGGDPNQDPNQVWSKQDGKGEIVPKETTKEFDWNPNGTPTNGPDDQHINISLKEDDTFLVKIGNERWMGATPEQREQFFYPDLNSRIPGLGDLARGAIEDKNGPLRQGLYALAEQQGNTDPRAQFSGDGALPDDTAPKAVPYGTTPTPIPWEEPNREGVEQQEQVNQINLAPPLPGVVPAAQPVAAPEPAPVNPVDAAIKSAEQGVNDLLASVLPPAV